MLGITEVIDNLYISGLESRQAILTKGIRCVINISSECPMQDLGPTVEYEKVSILDLPTTSIQPYFDRLTARIHQNLQQGKKTLVHCYVGRSRSATIILAYLMKYKQMSLREAFHYLRARRHIIGPNFGFIKQLIMYEKSLFGYTSVSFVNTSFGSVPDIYLSMPTSRPLRQPTRTIIPNQTTNNNTLGRTLSSPKATLGNSSPIRSSFLYSSSPTLSLPPRQNSVFNRSTTSALPPRSTTTLSSYTNTYNHAANSSHNRPVSSSTVYQNHASTTGNNNITNSSINRQQPEQSRINSTSTKPFELTREFVIPTKFNAYRTVKYVPSSYNRYHLQ
ncbi:unnamed protein product [Rotaria sp. Silwood1]|nr:unnamed protein product [Rotaria sp. Silwood1]CAF0738184.1 unnamed protein product [Rotaria sp. Silwood1]CAF0793011.1 unnamed protein product [Rotaria sp. Silwood1]CAF3327205.1 unnamed protein product [Rotaria sp. Silwood1]CAF3334618.1 unnamed protein product [Rotaria sp. Silwood1]